MGDELGAFRSLSTKLLAIYLPLVGLVLTVMFAVLEYRYYRNQQDALISKLRDIIEVQATAFATPIWEFDQPGIQFLLDALGRDEDIQGVGVLDSRDNLLGRTGDIETPPSIPQYRRERDIVFNTGGVKETVGRIIVVLRQDRIVTHLKDRLQIDIVIMLSLAVVLVLVTHVSSERVVGRPLRHLQRAMRRTTAEGLREKVDWQSNDELGEVVGVYNEMQEAQAAAEAEVARYRDHLEALVAERTAELEQSRTELAQQTEILQTVLDSISQGLVAFDKKLNLIAWNANFLSIRAYPENLAERGRPFADFIAHDVARDEFGDGDPEAIFQDQIERAQKFERHHFERQRPNGSFIEVRGGPIPGGGFVSTYADVTKRKEAEAELAAKEAQLRAALDTMRGGIFMVDRDLRLQIFNDRLREFYNLPEGVVRVGAPLEDILRVRAGRGDYGPGNADDLVRQRVEGYRDPSVVHMEDQILGGRIIETFRAPTAEGGIVVVFYDITERKEAEEELKRAHGLITESIDYASRIQRSVLPSETILKEHMEDYFILWEPKDVVGGDAFWYRPCENGFLVVCADCTGHGVPGALMTMIATGALDQALIEIPNGYPSAVLQRMNQLVKAALGQDGVGGESDNGLELGICQVDPIAGELTFAGARFFLWVLEGDRLSEIKGDRKGIGYRRTDPAASFTAHTVPLVPDCVFYMTSDGLIDQIGGSKRRSFGKRRLRDLILKYRDQPMVRQKESIYGDFSEYQGTESRRDDLSMIAFKPRL